MTQDDQPSDSGESQNGGVDWTWIYIGVVLGIVGLPLVILLFFLAIMLCASAVVCIIDARRARLERTRAGEEFAITPLSAPPPTSAVAPSP